MPQLSLIALLLLLPYTIDLTEAIRCNQGTDNETIPVDCNKDVKQCFSIGLDYSAVKNFVEMTGRINFFCDDKSSCKNLDRINSMTGAEHLKAENISLEKTLGFTFAEAEKKLDFAKVIEIFKRNPNDAVAAKNYSIALLQNSKMRARCCNTDLCNTLANA